MSLSLHCQNATTVSLWKSKIPNSVSSKAYDEKTEYKEARLIRSSQVSIPTLTIYTPKPEVATGAAVVVSPGDGYNHLTMNKEGLKVGTWLSSIGITVFVLKYRLPSDKIMTEKSIGPLQDAQETMRYIRRHAKQYNLNINKIGVLGFSTGGHLASTLSTQFNKKIYTSDNSSARPDFCILIYPLISMENDLTHQGSRERLLGEFPSDERLKTYSNDLHVTTDTPPTLLIHATDDQAVPVENSLNYYAALKRHRVPVALHIFEKGGHGFGLSQPESKLFWKDLCENWLELHNII